MNTLNKTKKSLLIATVSAIFLSAIFSFVPQREIKELQSAVFGSLQSELTSTSSDLFNCGGRNDCEDDVNNTINESQHKYTAQAYDKFGFPLSGVKYKWTQDDQNDIIKFRELNPASGLVDKSSITANETDQEIYVQPNESDIQNGEATVNVLGYLGSEEQGKSQSVDVDLFFCLNSWPSATTFPFADKSLPQFPPYTNFKTFYCKDRGSATNPGDDYTSLKVVERAKIGSVDNSYLCSGGGGNNLKCDKDYLIKSNYNNTSWTWTKNSLHNNIVKMLDNISSPDAIGINSNQILATEEAEWAYYDGSEWSYGKIPNGFPAIIPQDKWPSGPVSGKKLKPTALAINGTDWILIEGNFYATSLPAPSELPTSASAIKTLSEAGWPTDVQFPDDVAWWSNGGKSYLLALKGDYYRIYSKNNSCSNSKCKIPSGREWGSCSANTQCYWGELFSLYSKRDWPTNIDGWQNNIKFSIKTIGLDTNNVITTSSCEYSGGICLLKEFLLIANPACSDGIDNDNDQLQQEGGCDWQDNLCGAGTPKDPDCASSDDNSESGTCDDGLDNDNDGSIDYPADFSCDSYSDVEENGCANNQQCCDNKDNDNDGLVDQSDGGCDNKTDVAEVNLCADGIDNDGDGAIDLNDPGCVDSVDNNEKGTTQCDDGIDNDNDGSIDYPADSGCDRPGDDQELNN